MKTLLVTCSLIFITINTNLIAQNYQSDSNSSMGFYFQPEYSSMFLKNHIGNAVGFGIGIVSKNKKWDYGIRYYGRSGPINEHNEYELKLKQGETYKGKSSVMLGADHGYLGLEVAYTLHLNNDRIALRFPVSFGQFGAGFYLKGEDRYTPDGERTSEWEDKLQDGMDAGFGLSSEFGSQIIYRITNNHENIHFMFGIAYTNTFGYESFLGEKNFYNNKLRSSFGFRFNF
jgi:hypothetical protein